MARTQTTLRVKNGTITLPKELQEAWKGADVFVSYSKDSFLAKKMQKPELPLSEMIGKFQQAAKQTGLTAKDVEKAINEVRKIQK